MGDFDSRIAELIAICYGLDEAARICNDLDIDVELLRICSDCQSALDLCVGETEPNTEEDARILDSIRNLSSKFKIVEFQWVRAHAYNKFNEMADTIAYFIARG